MARVFGDRVRDIRFFRFDMFEFEGQDLGIARSGYSKQGGFEIYVEGSEIGMPLWNALFAAVQGSERARRLSQRDRADRGRLLSYGNDMTTTTRRMNVAWASSATRRRRLVVWVVMRCCAWPKRGLCRWSPDCDWRRRGAGL